jgi:hypothetical protein
VPASQPGDHLAAIEDDRGTAAVAVPALIHPEVRDLAGRLGALAAVGSDAADPDRAAAVDLIYARSRGNALYATYLCRQVIGRTWASQIPRGSPSSTHSNGSALSRPPLRKPTTTTPTCCSAPPPRTPPTLSSPARRQRPAAGGVARYRRGLAR